MNLIDIATISGRVTHASMIALASAIVPLGVLTKQPPLSATESPPAKSTTNGTPDRQSTDNLDQATLDLMRRQERLHPAATLLINEVARLPTSGFMDIGFESDGLTLRWKGELPAAVQSALAVARQIGPVRVRSATYSRAELEAAAAKIHAVASRQPHDIQAIKIRGDGGGLIIERFPQDIAALRRTKSGRVLIPPRQAVTAAGVTLPVSIITALRPVRFQSCAGACKRTDDEPWWNSGGKVRMRHNASGSYYGGCTGAFAVTVPAWGGQTTYVLTAAHCGTWHAGAGDFFYDGAGEYIGRAMINEDWRKDIMLVDARGWYWMWDGSPTTTYHKTVRSWGYPISGELVCLSGASSGTRCHLKTQPDLLWFLEITDSDGDTFQVNSLQLACRVLGSQPASMDGDSGAPVFALDGTGVRAKGVHVGGDGECTWWQDMGTITSDSSTWVRVMPYVGN